MFVGLEIGSHLAAQIPESRLSTHHDWLLQNIAGACALVTVIGMLSRTCVAVACVPITVVCMSSCTCVAVAGVDHIIVSTSLLLLVVVAVGDDT